MLTAAKTRTIFGVQTSRLVALAVAIYFLNVNVHADPNDQDIRVEDRRGLEMFVDTSRILTLDEEIPRVLIKNQKLLKVIPLTPNKVEVSAVAPGATQIELRGKSGEVHTVNVIIHGDAREMNDAIAQRQLHFAWMSDGMTASAQAPFGRRSSDNDKQYHAKKELMGKWIVREVIRDGEKHPAQVGREVGDVITMKFHGDQFGFG